MAVLKAKQRSEKGTHAVRRLRKQGRVPGILYGHGEQPVPLSFEEHEIELAVLHGERLVEIDVEGQRGNALIKEVQYDALGQEILHVDLTRVDLNERVEVTVPVVLRGTPAGVNEGGVLQQLTTEINIECLVRAIPEEIRVLVSELKIGETLHLSDVPLPQDAKLLDDPNAILCSVNLVEEAEEVAPAEEEAAAEPEVIGEKAEEEESKEAGGE